MAGLFRDEPDGRRFTIITTAANDSMKQVHDRMPLIIGQSIITDWIFDSTVTKDILQTIPKELNHSQEYQQMTLFDLP